MLSKLKIGGKKVTRFRTKIKIFFKCHGKRAGLLHFDVNTMPFVVFLFVFIFPYCQQCTGFYRQSSTEQMLIKGNAVLSVAFKKNITHSSLNAISLMRFILLTVV